MNQDLSILHLVLNASAVVQAVMLLLMGVSVTSWAAIFRKFFALKRTAPLLPHSSLPHSPPDSCFPRNSVFLPALNRLY